MLQVTDLNDGQSSEFDTRDLNFLFLLYQELQETMKNRKPWVIAAYLGGKGFSLKVLSATLVKELRFFCSKNFQFYVYDGAQLPEKSGKGKSEEDFWQKHFGEKEKYFSSVRSEFRGWIERQWNSAMSKPRRNMITETRIKQEPRANEDTSPYKAIKLKLEMRICKSCESFEKLFGPTTGKGIYSQEVLYLCQALMEEVILDFQARYKDKLYVETKEGHSGNLKFFSVNRKITTENDSYLKKEYPIILVFPVAYKKPNSNAGKDQMLIKDRAKIMKILRDKAKEF